MKTGGAILYGGAVTIPRTEKGGGGGTGETRIEQRQRGSRGRARGRGMLPSVGEGSITEGHWIQAKRKRGDSNLGMGHDGKNGREGNRTKDQSGEGNEKATPRLRIRSRPHADSQRQRSGRGGGIEVCLVRVSRRPGLRRADDREEGVSPPQREGTLTEQTESRIGQPSNLVPRRRVAGVPGGTGLVVVRGCIPNQRTGKAVADAAITSSQIDRASGTCRSSHHASALLHEARLAVKSLGWRSAQHQFNTVSNHFGRECAVLSSAAVLGFGGARSSLNDIEDDGEVPTLLADAIDVMRLRAR
ncbi:hypothetical protein MRB53_039944 [Persea americana]|nr:hypothetical protein MRB53_039944 [Persea americana]